MSPLHFHHTVCADNLHEFGVYAVYKMPSCCIWCRHGTATIGIDWVSVQMLCLHTFHDIVWPNRYTYQLQSQTLQPSICTQSSAHPSSTCHQCRDATHHFSHGSSASHTSSTALLHCIPQSFDCTTSHQSVHPVMHEQGTLLWLHDHTAVEWWCYRPSCNCLCTQDIGWAFLVSHK